MKNQLHEISSMSMHKTAFFFLLALMLSSFADIRFSLGGKELLTLGVFELCSYVSLLAGFAFVLIRSQAEASTTPAVTASSRWIIWYVIWGIFASVIIRGDAGMSIVQDLKKVFPGIITYFIVILLVADKKQMIYVLGAWTLAGLVNAILAFSQFFLGGPHPVQPGSNAFDKLDIGGDVATNLVTGFFSHPNTFSQIVIPFFVIFTTSWLISKKPFSISSMLLLILGSVFGLVLVLTYAKGAILWSGLAILITVVIRKCEGTRSFKWFLFLWLLCVTGINLFALYFVSELEIKALTTLFSRIEFIVTSYMIFKDHPLNFMIGGGMQFWKEYSSIWASWDFPNAHNVYLNQILLHGFIGVSFFLGFILIHIRDVLTLQRTVNEPLMSPYPYIAAVFAITGSYFFEPAFADPIQKSQLLFVISLLAVTTKTQNIKALE